MAIHDITERKGVEARLQRTTRALRTTKMCNQILVRAETESALLGGICRALVAEGGYRLAWVGFAENDEQKTVRPVACAGFEEGYLEKLRVSWADTERGRGPTGTAIRTGQPAVCRNVLTDPNFTPWRADAIKRGYGSSSVLPLNVEGKAFGALNIFAVEPDAFDAEEEELLTGLADDLAYGIRVIRVRKKRQEVAEALRREQILFNNLISTIPDHIYFKDRQSRFIRINDAQATRFGLSSPSEAVGKTDFDIFSEEHARQAYEDEQRIMRTGEPLIGLEEKETWPDGHITWVSTTKVPLNDANGNITGIVGISRDITDRKLLEDRLRQAQKMEAVGQLASGVAHDYNNILTATLIQLGLLLDDPHLAPEVKNSLKELLHAAERAANLTRQLLMFSRRQIIQVKPLDLNEVLADLVKMLRRLLGELVSLEFQGGTAPLWIEADRGMMEQVVMNLCVNARDAMLPKGGRLTIDARRVELGAEALRRNPEARPGTFVCLGVTDNGCGMDEAVLKHLFEPFFTTKEVGKGTGLGLAIVYGITKQHRGWVDVTSQVGQGSAFRVYLPASSEGPPATPKAARVEVKRGSETILLVEDEELVRQTVAITLRWYGYRVLEAADGPEAIRIWDEHAGEIDLLFSDMVMPGGFTGLELFKRFKQAKAALKAIISSGYGAVLTGSTPPTGSNIGYLAKPYQITTLARAVRERLDQA